MHTSPTLFVELQEAEREALLFINTYWELCNNAKKYQTLLLHFGQKIRTAKTFLYLSGKIPMKSH